MIDHPLGGELPDGVARRAQQAARALADCLAPMPDLPEPA
jgi:hypothetical protein